MPAKEGERPAGPPSEEEFFRAPAARVPVKAGMNRFVWDMRYASAKDFPNMILWAGSTRGPMAPPGTYQVRLTAAGVTGTQSFSIARNPNTPGISDADLAEQFALALLIRDRVTQANEAVVRIRSRKDQIADRTKQWAATQKDRELSKAAMLADALTAKLTAIEGEIGEIYWSPDGRKVLCTVRKTGSSRPLAAPRAARRKNVIPSMIVASRPCRRDAAWRPWLMADREGVGCDSQWFMV